MTGKKGKDGDEADQTKGDAVFWQDLDQRLDKADLDAKQRRKAEHGKLVENPFPDDSVQLPAEEILTKPFNELPKGTGTVRVTIDESVRLNNIWQRLYREAKGRSAGGEPGKALFLYKVSERQISMELYRVDNGVIAAEPTMALSRTFPSSANALSENYANGLSLAMHKAQDLGYVVTGIVIGDSDAKLQKLIRGAGPESLKQFLQKNTPPMIDLAVSAYAGAGKKAMAEAMRAKTTGELFAESMKMQSAASRQPF